MHTLQIRSTVMQQNTFRVLGTKPFDGQARLSDGEAVFCRVHVAVSVYIFDRFPNKNTRIVHAFVRILSMRHVFNLSNHS